MANTVKVKRSATPAKVPTTADLALGEIAVNTYDGKMYIKKDDGTQSIVTINPIAGSGDVVGPASATDNAITRFDTTTGKLIQNSVVTIDDNGNTAGVNAVTFDTTPSTVPTAEGSLYWDSADGNQTLSLVMAGGTATQQIGEEIYFRIKASSAITNGQAVMFTGTVGGSGALTGAPASGLTDATSTYFMGIATQDIALNGWGYVTQFGLIRGINTTGGAEAWVDGQILYYNPAVAGGLTKTVPTAPAAKIQAAVVVNAASGGSGSLFVRPTINVSLEDLNDVETASATTNDLLQYDGSKWLHKAPSTVTGVGSALTLTTGRTIAITGDLTYTSPSFNGSGNVTAAGTLATVNSNVGSFTNASLTVNAKGLVTAVSSGTAPVTSVTGTAPIASSGGATPAISISQATTSTNGYLTSTDWNTFNNKTSNTGTVTSVAMTVPTGLTVTGSPITTSGTLAVTLTAGYSIPTTASQTNWDTAYSVRQQWTGGSTNLVAATGRTSLGGTTVGQNFFTLANPTAITFPRINADNTVSALDAATFRTAIGAGTSSTTGTVTSVAGTGTVSGLTLTGTVTTSGSLTLGGTLSLTSGNVTTALGYTPYNSTNPSGYITSSGSITGNAATATSATYLNSGNYIQNATFSGNLDTDWRATPAGSFRWQGDYPGGTNGAGGTWWSYENIRHNNDANYYGLQVAWGWADNSGRLATRAVNNNVFDAWVYYLNSANYNSYSPTLTGTGASGTWGISVTGSSASCTGNSATVTSITSGQVTTALGYTPYNSTNPSSYITTAGARTAVSFTAGSGAYNSTTGVFTIPTNTNQLTNGAGFTTNTGTVTSVSGTGTAGGLSLSGTVTTSGNITLSGTVNGAARAWANFNGATIRGSFNVSSVTVNGAGDFTINFTTGLGDGNYATLTTGSVGGSGFVTCLRDTSAAPASGSVRVASYSTVFASSSATYYNIACFR
jgi:hypothetical protein